MASLISKLFETGAQRSERISAQDARKAATLAAEVAYEVDTAIVDLARHVLCNREYLILEEFDLNDPDAQWFSGGFDEAQVRLVGSLADYDISLDEIQASAAIQTPDYLAALIAQDLLSKVANGRVLGEEGITHVRADVTRIANDTVTRHLGNTRRAYHYIDVADDTLAAVGRYVAAEQILQAVAQQLKPSLDSDISVQLDDSRYSLSDIIGTQVGAVETAYAALIDNPTDLIAACNTFEVAQGTLSALLASYAGHVDQDLSEHIMGMRTPLQPVLEQHFEAVGEAYDGLTMMFDADTADVEFAALAEARTTLQALVERYENVTVEIADSTIIPGQELTTSDAYSAMQRGIAQEVHGILDRIVTRMVNDLLPAIYAGEDRHVEEFNALSAQFATLDTAFEIELGYSDVGAVRQQYDETLPRLEEAITIGRLIGSLDVAYITDGVVSFLGNQGETVLVDAVGAYERSVERIVGEHSACETYIVPVQTYIDTAVGTYIAEQFGLLRGAMDRSVTMHQQYGDGALQTIGPDQEVMAMHQNIGTVLARVEDRYSHIPITAEREQLSGMLATYGVQVQSANRGVGKDAPVVIGGAITCDADEVTLEHTSPLRLPTTPPARIGPQ